jgi:hypothetical protein
MLDTRHQAQHTLCSALDTWPQALSPAPPDRLALPRSEYTPPEAKLVMRQKDVVDCLSTQHISDSSLVCTAPEMTALNASIVIVATGLQSKLWAETSIIYADQLPGG